MSQRRKVGGRDEDQLPKLLRALMDDVDRLKSGSVLFGQASVGQLTIGSDIVLTVEEPGGENRNLVFTNKVNKARYVIPL